MRLLFVSNYFPGELGPLAKILGEDPANDLLFAANRQRKDYHPANVRRIQLKRHEAIFTDAAMASPQMWQGMLKVATGSRQTLLYVRESWGVPDIMFLTMASGAAFFAPQVFPEAFIVAYAEAGHKNFWLLPEEIRKSWMLATSTLFLRANLCFAFSRAQKELFPKKIRGQIKVLRPYVDTDVFSPPKTDMKPATKVITFHATNTAADRLAGLAAIAGRILEERKDLRVMMLVENRNLEKDMANTVKAQPWRQRFATASSMSFEDYHSLLASSLLVVRPFSRDYAPLLESMSCATPVMTMAASADFLKPGVNMLDLPEKGQCEAVMQALQREDELRAIGAAGRRTMKDKFSQDRITRSHLASVLRAHAAWLENGQP